jgi:hypothetical protein
MGYYTRYSLEIMPEPSNELLEEQVYGISIMDLMYDDSNSMKWYSHEKDMTELSTAYPGYTFILDGDGEDAGDVWRSFYKNGKHYDWKLKFERPDFDELKLR